jgi:WSC domain
MLQTTQSCVDSSGTLNVVAAVRGAIASPSVSLSVATKNPRQGVIVPALYNSSGPMFKLSTVGLYDLYSTTYALTAAQVATSKFDVSLGGGIADSFKNSGDLGVTCASGPPAASSTTTPTSTPTSIPSQTTLGIKPTVASYSYLGCYSDSAYARVLPDTSESINNMTLEVCAAFCKSYPYFGVEYGQECYCGNALDSSAVLEQDSDCSYTCPGTGGQYEYCGAGNRISVYKLKSSSVSSTPTTTPTSTTTPPSTSSPPPAQSSLAVVRTVSSYSYLGCYTDSAYNRVLPATSESTGTMTLEVCAAFCKTYAFFGVEYGQECYCGNALGSSANLQDDSDCYYTCASNSFEYCGAGNRIGVYGKASSSSSSTNSVSASTTSTSTTSILSSTTSSTLSQTTLGIKPTVGAYTYLGCRSDSPYARVLLATSTSTASMTLEACATFCSAYAYFGTEYSQECYCGNALATSAATEPDSDCSYTCGGSQYEYCGAGNRLSVYQKK